jgi:DNA-binding transcriptional LysR family regulator
MEPHLLRTFIAVAERGSFSAAAGRLGYTQSAVSQQIAALESDLGTPLLYRRPVAMTEAGARLLEHARPILLRLDAARAEVTRAGAPLPGRLVVGASPLAALPLAASALAAVRRSRPRLAVTLRVISREAISEQVADGTLDLGLLDGAVAPGDPLRLPAAAPLTATMVAEDWLAVALPTGHPLAGRSALRLEQLADARWLDAPDTGMPLADLRAVTGTDGFRPSLAYQGTDVAALVSLAAAGHGLAVLPRSVLDGVPGVTAVPVSGPPLVHRAELLHGTAAGQAATALIAALAGQDPPGE